MSRYDLAVLGGTVVIPEVGTVRADLGIADGRITALAASLNSTDAQEVFDATGLFVMPGAIDSHFHVGIYRPFREDALSESGSAASGGVTTILSYFRTGQHYLNKTGPYHDIFPEVRSLSTQGYWCDYGYHIAPMTTAQLDEVEWLIDQGVSSFKFYMFYKGLTLAADSTQGRQYVMSDEYDLGHLYELMSRIAAAAQRRGTRISLSLHCENPELIRVFIAKVKSEGLRGLEAYSKARPPLSESLSIEEAGVLARSTTCPINLLHLSSKDAVESAIALRRRYPEADILLETTLHHLMLSYEEVTALGGKVNPPIRTKADCEAIWRAVLAGEINTVVSDHACCLEALKGEDLWTALPGFGGTSLLYPVLLSEGVQKRGMPIDQAVRLISATPARKYGLYPRKGTISIGSDADLAICDMATVRTVAAAGLHSAQDHSPFSGLKFSGWPVATVLRGRIVFRNGKLQGRPQGEYLHRPVKVEDSVPEPHSAMVGGPGE
jgi:dihydroorotase-like cyclic amidohydrolase